jgi:hypothetical protein
MAPHPERKHAPPPLPPRVTRRGPSAGTPTPAKPWRVVENSFHTVTPGKNIPRRLPRENVAPVLSEAMGIQSPLLQAEGFPFSILEEPTRNLEDVGRGVAHKLRT